MLPTESAQDHLCCYSARHIPCWIWQFLRHVGHCIWRTNSESPIQYTCQESNTVAPACRIVLAEIAPYSRIASVNLGHCRNHNDRYEAAKDDEEQADVIQERQKAVPKYNNGTTEPSDQDEGDIDMPWLNSQIGMKNKIHLYCYVRRD